jgi:hypothetical protein
MEAHRIEMENHRKEMEATQRQRDQENQERFRENQKAIEDKVQQQEQALREQEASQRAFEAAQREQEAAQRQAEKERWQSQLSKQNGKKKDELMDDEPVESVGRMVGSACSSNPCQNSGVCEVQKTGFRCVCQKPWTGALCETGKVKANYKKRD